jgi:hypothetical protein
MAQFCFISIGVAGFLLAMIQGFRIDVLKERITNLEKLVSRLHGMG